MKVNGFPVINDKYLAQLCERTLGDGDIIMYTYDPGLIKCQYRSNTLPDGNDLQVYCQDEYIDLTFEGYLDDGNRNLFNVEIDMDAVTSRIIRGGVFKNLREGTKLQFSDDYLMIDDDDLIMKDGQVLHASRRLIDLMHHSARSDMTGKYPYIESPRVSSLIRDYFSKVFKPQYEIPTQLVSLSQQDIDALLIENK